MPDEKTIKKSKLIKLLTSFSDLEWKRFARFVQSPYFNTNQQLIAFTAYLKKAAPFDNLKTLEQARISQKLYGKGPFKLNQFQKLCSELYQLASDFIINEQLQREKRQRERLRIAALSERNYDLFEGASRQLIKEIKTQPPYLDAADFLLLHQLNDELHHHLATDKFTVDKKELVDAWNYLHAFYRHQQMAFKAEHRGSQNFLKQNISTADGGGNQLTELLQAVVNLHEQKEPDLYFELKDKVLTNWHKLKRKHQTDLLVHLINFSFTNQLLQKDLGHKETLALYKIGIEHQLFIINGKMRDVEFVNIGMIGYALEAHEWTDHFIENHRQYLPKEVSDFLVPFLYAYKANFRGAYHLVIELLSKLRPTNQLRYLSKMKSLLIRAYVEGIFQGEIHYRLTLDYEIDSLKKMMVRNKKIAQTKAEAYLNFLNLTKQLLSLLSDGASLEKITMFERAIETTKPLILQVWLRKKVEQLKNAASQ